MLTRLILIFFNQPMYNPSLLPLQFFFYPSHSQDHFLRMKIIPCCSCLKSFSSALPPPLSSKWRANPTPLGLSCPRALRSLFSHPLLTEIYTPFILDIPSVPPPPKSCVRSHFHTFAPFFSLGNCPWPFPTLMSVRNFHVLPLPSLLATFHCWCLFFLPLVSKLFESRPGLFTPVFPGVNIPYCIAGLNEYLLSECKI